ALSIIHRIPSGSAGPVSSTVGGGAAGSKPSWMLSPTGLPVARPISVHDACPPLPARAYATATKWSGKVRATAGRDHAPARRGGAGKTGGRAHLAGPLRRRGVRAGRKR